MLQQDICAFATDRAAAAAVGVVATGATAAVAKTGMARFRQARVPRSVVVLSSGGGAAAPSTPAERACAAHMLGMPRCRGAMGVQENPALLLQHAAARRRALRSSH